MLEGKVHSYLQGLANSERGRPPESARLQQSKHQNIGHRGHDEYRGAARDLRMHLYHFIDEKTEPQRGKCAQGQLENHSLKSISVS